jgi:hypothetical protein
MSQMILALVAALAFLSAGALAVTHHPVAIVTPDDVTPPEPI